MVTDMNQEHKEKVLNGTKGEMRRGSESSSLVSNKLKGPTADSKMCDSGISAEIPEEVETVEADNINHTAEAAVRPSTIPLKSGLSSEPSIESPLLLVPHNSSAQGALFNEISPHSTVSEVSRSDSNTSASAADKRRILRDLINERKKKDSRWEPSGRYHANLADLEEGITNQLARKKKAREDARKVLEMFLESSLRGDPEFQPSGHYMRHRASIKFPGEGRSSTKRDVTSAEESSPTVPYPVTLRVASPSAEHRPLSTILQVESATERGSDLSGLSHQRDSYYFAVNDTKDEDDCISEVRDALQQTIQLASQDSDDSIHISPIPLETTTQVADSGAVVETKMQVIKDELHIHKHSELERCVSSSTSLSSILDDGGLTDLHLTNRKKKSFFTRASERLQHVFHRSARSVERSESRSESEAEKYSVKPRPPNRKKKRRLNFSKKQANKDIVNTKVLQSHQHHLRLKTTAQIAPAGIGLNEELWRNAESPQGIVGKGKASTLPSWDAYAKESQKTGKDKERVKERWDKSVKELIKEVKNTRKPDRSESTRSTDSIFRFLNVRKSNKSESPKVDRREKSTFSLRKRKKKPEGDGKSSDMRQVVSSYSPVKPETHSAASKDNLLHPPVDSPQQQRSKSADQIVVAFSAESSIDKAGKSLRLTPQHSRSRSAQETSDTFYSFSNDSSAASRPSSSPSKPPTEQVNMISASRCSSNEQKRPYVPRSQPGLSTAPHPRLRRHTTEVQVGDLPSIATAGVKSNLSVSGALQDSVDVPMEVDAKIERTHSLSIRNDGKKVLKTVAKIDEVVSFGRSKRKQASADAETDSEIERISHIPFDKRTKEEQDNLYRHIAGKISKMVPVMSVDESFSSPCETPMDGPRGPTATAYSSDQSSTFVTARSDSTSPTYHQSLELHTTTSSQITGSFAVDHLPEGEAPLPPETSLTESSVTKTDVAALAEYFRVKGDAVHENIPALSNLSQYEVFAELADDVMRSQPQSYWGQIAGVFGVTLNAVKYMSKTPEYVSQVKENALKYIEDKFASYILSNGGWDSVLEESNSEID